MIVGIDLIFILMIERTYDYLIWIFIWIILKDYYLLNVEENQQLCGDI